MAKMTIKQYLHSIGEDYEVYKEMKNTQYFSRTQGQELLANMLYEAMSEGIIRHQTFGRIKWANLEA